MMMGRGSQKEGVQLVLLMVVGPPSHTWPHHLHLLQTAGHVRPLHCWQCSSVWKKQTVYHVTVESHSLL